MSGSEIAEKQPGKEQGETRMWGKHIGMAAWFCVAATGAYASDLDEDGLDDDWELKLFGSIEAEQADGDPDLDGLDNLEEQERGTHPLLVDTDDDFLTDGEEIDKTGNITVVR